MKHAWLFLFAAPLLLFTPGCAVTIDGYDADYVEQPAFIERYPRINYRGATVYEINGRYYRRYGHRWVVYRRNPSDLRR